MSEQKKKGKLSFFALDPKCDKYINWAVALLLLIGTFTIVSTNVGKTTYAPNIVPKVIVKQSIFCVCGYIAMVFKNRMVYCSTLFVHNDTSICVSRNWRKPCLDSDCRYIFAAKWIRKTIIADYLCDMLVSCKKEINYVKGKG